MKEIFKKSTICFTDETEYNKFKDNCLLRSKNYCGWEIIKEYNLIKFDERLQGKDLFKFKVTFDMVKT